MPARRRRAPRSARVGGATSQVAYVHLVRRSTRIAFAICWPVFAVTVFLSWRKVTATPDGDITGLLLATILGTAGLTLLEIWLQDRETGPRRPQTHGPVPTGRA